MDIKLMKELSEAFGVTGFEDETASIMEREFRKNGWKTERDTLGNVRAMKNRKQNPVVIAAHMDEIGLAVKYLNEKGFLRFIKIGGVDPRALINQIVKIRTDKADFYGVIGSKPPHLQKPEEQKNAYEIKNLFIDVGAKDRKSLEKMGIKVGDPISFVQTFRELGNGLICGKGLDNRIGCYVLTQLSKTMNNVMLLGTTQEEVSWNGKGATTAAFDVQPSAFIAVDTCIAGDHPELPEDETGIKLGGGPGIALIEAGGRGNIADKKLYRKVIETARRYNIPYQLEVSEGGATDAASVHNVRGGVPSLAIGVPTRYIHSCVGVANVADIENTIKLIQKIQF